MKRGMYFCMRLRFMHIVFPLIFLVIVASCDLFDQILNNKKVNGEIIFEEVIGSGGAVISTDSLYISFPEGVFKSNQNIKILRLPFDSIPIQGSVSEYYRLEGLNEDLLKSVSIKVLPNSIQEKTLSSIVYLDSYNQFTDEQEKWPILATDSLGWIVFTIQPPNVDSLKNAFLFGNGSTTSYSWFALTQSKRTTTNFSIYYNTNESLAKIDNVASYLENAVLKFESLGFIHSISNGEVYVWKIKNYGGVSQSGKTGKIWMEINNELLKDDEELKVTIGHEMFHWFQYNYDRAFWAGLKNVWLDEAFAVWSETLFAGSAAHYPVVITGNEIEPFQGIQLGAERQTGETGTDNSLKTDHGYGMASLIKYMVKKYGNTYPLKVYNEIKNGKNAVFAIHKSAGYGLASDWKYFMRDLMLGDLFNNPGNSFYRNFIGKYNLATNIFEISSNDTIVSYLDQYPDLSAKVYRIDFGSNFLEKNQDFKLKLKLESFIDKSISMESLLVYKADNQKISLIGETNDSIVITDFNDAKYILALVVNQNFADIPLMYTNKKDIELTIETVGEPEGCQGGFMFDAIMRISNSKGVENDTVTDFLIMFPYIESMTQNALTLAYAQGILSGNTYKAKWNEKVNIGASSDYNLEKGQVDITFNQSRDLITSLELSDTTCFVSGNGNTFYYVNIKCINVPFNNRNGTVTQFGVEGNGVAGYIQSINYNELYYDGSTRKLIEYSSSGGSLVSVIFKGQTFL